MLAANTVAFAVFIANCWWESVAVCYAASVAPLGLQLLRARFDGESPLRSALAFGALCAGVWPLGEGVVVRTAGWWGQYLAPGPRVWDTPLYCMLVGWLASTHVYYWARRTEEFGYGRGAAVACAGLTALASRGPSVRTCSCGRGCGSTIRRGGIGDRYRLSCRYLTALGTARYPWWGGGIS